jgi:PAS domain S-box-containing protein
MDDISHEKLLENLFDGVYYVDRDKTIVYWNKAAERISGFARSEVIGKRCSDNILRHINDEGHELCIEGCPLAQSLTDGKIREADVYLHHRKATGFPYRYAYPPYGNPTAG